MVIDKMEQFNKGTMFPEDYNENYLLTEHISTDKLVIPENVLENLKNEINARGLYFGNDDVLKEIVAGLIKGNIILQGPPGTGKTTLAKALCKVFNVEFDEATATSDWTTYDTIGGLQPDFDGNNEVLAEKNGCIVESVLHCCNTVLRNLHYNEKKQASWFIIDELNRCEIDKAFGELFTVFGSDSSEKKAVRLWYEKDANKRKIFIPNRYRIIGAMNNIDKNFVYDISQGLSRRFTFIEILPPEEQFFDKEISNAKKQAKDRVIKKIGMYGSKKIDLNYFSDIDNSDGFSAAEDKVKKLLKHIRYEKAEDSSFLGLETGTAQIIDAFETFYILFILGELDPSKTDENTILSFFDTVITSRVVPQMDGFDYMKLNSFYDGMSKDTDYSRFIKTKNVIHKLIS